MGAFAIVDSWSVLELLAGGGFSDGEGLRPVETGGTVAAPCRQTVLRSSMRTAVCVGGGCLCGETVLVLWCGIGAADCDAASSRRHVLKPLAMATNKGAPSPASTLILR